ncbi:two component transcriptional regulator, winged helix family [Colwellia chukchiensis]|uniref:Two component transcriptional regulator, winged helix family n=1 Tax=Colwellia chukchiensis TaxID=641665 RepID=A0A1H7KBN2_9GAMM|nr:response regulator transcription factor [Colwellia chukchiensis]SEK83345.1 two component transcriptional regulator, winged helix family [Colwellia chukchiensis]
MRILLIEDDENLQQQVKAHLMTANYSVDVASDGEVGLFQGQEFPYDAAIIDLGLPKIDGVQVVKTLREQGFSYPILILTARGSWQDKVSGLDAGADDYLTKPFHIEELIARLNALIRRSVGQASPLIENGPFAINTASMQVTVAQQVVSLSSYEYKLFEYLMHHVGKVKSKSELTEHIYDQDFDLDSNVIEVFIRRLRKKLDPDNQYQFIETLRGQGYLLKDFTKQQL